MWSPDKQHPEREQLRRLNCYDFMKRSPRNFKKSSSRKLIRCPPPTRGRAALRMNWCQNYLNYATVLLTDEFRLEFLPDFSRRTVVWLSGIVERLRHVQEVFTYIHLVQKKKLWARCAHIESETSSRLDS